jgi:hypothetical protein
MDAVTVQVTGRTTALPSDYWHATFTEAWYIDPDTGHRGEVRLLDRRTWHDTIVPSNQGDGPPESACVVKNQGAADAGSAPTGVIMVNPVWSTHYLLELHYNPLPVPLALITTKPWLPFSLYLIKRLAGELLQDQDDQRAAGTLMLAATLKRDILKSSVDPGQRPKQMRLSREVFASPVRI